MVVNPDIIEELYDDAGNARVERAREYVKKKKVKIKKVVYDNQSNFEIRSHVLGNFDDYDVYIKVTDGEIQEADCDCADYNQNFVTCKHILASIMEFNQNSDYIRIFAPDKNSKDTDISIYKTFNQNRHNEKYRAFKQLINEFHHSLHDEIRLLIV